MLDIVPVTKPASDDDWCFAFAGYNAVSSLLGAQGLPWRRRDLRQDFPQTDEGVAIGEWQGSPAYAVAVPDAALEPMRHASGSLYSMLGRVDDALFAAHGRALQLLRWQRENQFCGVCGAPMKPGDGGRAMACSACQFSRYPQLAPCAIVLVTRGAELLLAQAAGRGPGFYSTLAGFVEAGETVEQTVAREVREEVGLEVDSIRYFGSQPWPFPGQLMLGFFANYAGGDIRPDPTEIADAQWFHPDDLPPVPPRVSISGQLIHHFIEQQARST